MDSYCSNDGSPVCMQCDSLQRQPPQGQAAAPSVQPHRKLTDNPRPGRSRIRAGMATRAGTRGTAATFEQLADDRCRPNSTQAAQVHQSVKGATLVAKLRMTSGRPALRCAGPTGKH